MSVTDQLEHYDGKKQVTSDPFGLIDRDNRNHRKKADIIIDETRAGDGDRVLEVGCGHGLHAGKYSKRFAYYGIDLSASLIDTCRRNIDDGTFVTSNALSLPFADGTFDAVIGSAILHHLPRPEVALEEWQRVVRPGGDVTLIEPNYLFPKDLLTAHLVTAERHKVMMAPWRIRRLLERCTSEYRLAPRIYTPPWPVRWSHWYDRIDERLESVYGLRWASQLILIQLIL